MTLRFLKPQTKADTLTVSEVFATRTLPAKPRLGIIGIAIYLLILVIGIMIGISASMAFLRVSPGSHYRHIHVFEYFSAPFFRFEKLHAHAA
jgi:hypothetical protein